MKRYSDSSWRYSGSWWGRDNTVEDLDPEENNRSTSATPEHCSSSRDLSSGCSNHDDDPYEYDEDIPKYVGSNCEEIYEDNEGSPPREEPQQTSSDASTTGLTPCWGCKSCNGDKPLFFLSSPAETPCTCVSC